MTTRTTPDPTATLAAAPRDPESGRLGGVGLMLSSGVCAQVGASFAALAFPVIGPVGVVAIRQWVAGGTLLAVGRPRIRSFTAAQWRLVTALAAIYAVMNLSVYLAIARVGLGLAITLEFLGPLTVALAGSRRRVDLGCALAAGAAVVELTRPKPSSNYAGIGLALLGATCWACYVLLNQAVGARLPGLQGTAAAAALSSAAYLPVGAVALWLRPPTAGTLGYAVAAGVLSSVVPFLTDLLALRRVAARFFGLFMSVNPLCAALAGWVVLGQRLDLLSWLAILVIAGANTVAVAAAGRAAGARRSAAADRRDAVTASPSPPG